MHIDQVVDSIEEAMNRARAEHQGRVGRVPQQRDCQFSQGLSNSDVDHADPIDPVASWAGLFGVVAPKKKWAAPPDLELPQQDIVYKKTRSVPVNENELGENRVIAGMNYDQRVEVYRRLRTQVLKILDDNDWNTLAITSPRGNAGKTLTATNLAIALSREVNHSVMLVDLDLRAPSVHKMFNLDVKYGLVDYLNGDITLEQALINPGFQRLVLLPGRPLRQYSSEILSSPEMNELVADISGRYESRIIVFDLPPLLCNDDALLFAPTADSVLLVLEEGVTTADDVERCMQLLDGSNLIGTVLNKAKGQR